MTPSNLFAHLKRTAFLFGILLASTLQADTTLLVDNFNANTPNTNDLNVDLARQTGFYAPTSYTMVGGPGHYAHQLQNPNALNQLLVADFGQSTSSLNRNFDAGVSEGGLRIAFDIDPVPDVYGGDPTNWGAINFGMRGFNQLVNVNGASEHMGILFRRTGTLQAFDGGANVTPVEPIYTASPGGGFKHIEIQFSDADGNPFDGVGSTQIDVFGDISPLPVFSYTKGGGGFADNFINLQGSFRAHFDNLTITKLGANPPPPVLPPPPPLPPTPIPGLFNTGVDDARALLPDNVDDPHYSLFDIQIPPNGPGIVGPDATLPADGFPIPPWVGNSATSRWIAPPANDGNGAGGYYYWETTFDMTGLDPDTAVVRGQWSSDNGGADILLNGVSTGNFNGAQFGALTPFEIGAYRGDQFVDGINSLIFVVFNEPGAPPSDNPTGLRVEGIVGGAIPEPSTIALAGLAVAFVAARRFRRLKVR
jgi:hypothetical protein